jgi:hypothetical protein
MNEMLDADLRETYAERDAGYDPSEALGRIRARAADMPIDRRRGLQPIWQTWTPPPGRGEPPPIRTRQRTGLTLAGILAVVAAVGVFALVNGLGGSAGRAGVGLSAHQVIARTAAFVTGSGDGILHVDATTTNFVGHHGSYTVDLWSEEKAPFDYRVSSTTVHEVKVGNTLIAYRSDFNQISVGNLRHGPVPVQVEDPLDTAIVEVDTTHGVGSLYRGEANSPAAFARALAKIINAPSVTVNRNAAFRGAPAVSITPANGRATLYADPIDYRPLELVTKIKVLGNDNKVVRSYTSTTIFQSYETLPHGSLKMPNLVLNYPHATVAPWERHYWKRYWSRVSSGSTQTRGRALDDLRNK